MAETVRSAAPVTQSLTVGDRSWIGMDTYTDANKLQDGYAQRITNLVVRNGSLVPRNAIVRLTSVARPGSFGSALAVRSSTNEFGSAVLVSNQSGASRFWKFDYKTQNPVPIPMAPDGTTSIAGMDCQSVRMAQFGRYVYIAPGKALSGSDRLPYRIDTNTKTSLLTSVLIGTNKFVKAGHGLTVGDPVVIVANSGGIPSPLQPNVVYYVTHVSGSDFYISTSLPTTTNTSVQNVLFAETVGSSVTLVTSFKGEVVPTATGLPEVTPVVQAFPFVAKSIPTSNVYNLVTSSLALSNTNQLLVNANFATGNNNAAPGTWTQFVQSGARTVTVKNDFMDRRPIPSSGQLILFDDNTDGSQYPGIWQEVPVVTETTTFETGTSTEACLIYTVKVRLIHRDNPSTTWKRPLAIRLKGMKASGGGFVEIDGASVSEVVQLTATWVRDAWTEVEVTADFRDFKNELGTTGRIRCELQLAADGGQAAGEYNAGLYCDYAYLFAVASTATTDINDVSVEPSTDLVRIKARHVNPSTSNLGGFVRDRSFYYRLSSNITVNLSSTGTHTVTAGTPPANGTPVSFASPGASGLTANKTYWVINASGSTFELSTELSGGKLSQVSNANNIVMVAGLSLKNTSYLSCQFFLPTQFESQDPSFSIGIQAQLGTGPMTTVTWGGKGSFDPVTRYLTFDLATLDRKLLENVRAVFIRCNNDFRTSNEDNALVVNGGTVLFYIGNLVYNGELQNQGQYQYAFTRWKAAPAYTTSTTQIQFLAKAPWTLSGTTSTYHGGVESSMSKASTPITANDAESRLRINIAASDFKDAAGDGYTHLLVYRRNNATFTDGRFRLLGQVDISGATPVLASSSSNLSLDAATTSTQVVLIDNVGDTELLFDKPIGQTGYVFREGKDFFPAGCQTVAVHQQRLWMSKANTLFSSWLVDNDNEYALHTTLVPLINDPYLPAKGASFDVSGQYDYDQIVAMVPFSGEGLSRSNSTSNALLILRNNSIAPVVGSDASNFAVLGFVREPGAGCIAPACATTMGGRVWWLSASGLMQYSEGLPAKVSVPLERLVNAHSSSPLIQPDDGQANIDMSVQSKSSAVVFDSKFIFTSMQPGGGDLNTLFVFDPLAKGWYEWSMPKDSQDNQIQPVSLFVFNSDKDAPTLYMACDNGHIYAYSGYGHDVPETSGVPFTWAVLTRQYGQTYAQGRAYYSQNRVHELNIHMHPRSAMNVNWKIFNDEQPELVSPVFNPAPNAFAAAGAWSFTPGDKSVSVRNIARDMRGTSYSVELSGTSVDNQTFRIYGVILYVSETAVRRQN